MSRTIGLAAALIWSGAAFAAEPADCVSEATAQQAEIGWTLTVGAACRPYQQIIVRYGLLVINEETGANGQVSVPLPMIPGAVALVDGFPGSGLELEGPSDGGPATGFLWIEGKNGQPRLLQTAGFPAGQGVLPELGMYPLGATPEALDIPVTAERCGQRLGFRMLRDGWDQPRDVTVTLPDCELVGAVVRLPVSLE